MSNDDNFAYNAADPSSVKKAEIDAKRARKKELNDIRSVLSYPHGRRFVWRLLEKANVFGSVWEPSARIHYKSGQQDFGHFIMGEITDADQNLLFKMMKENKQREES